MGLLTTAYTFLLRYKKYFSRLLLAINHTLVIVCYSSPSETLFTYNDWRFRPSTHILYSGSQASPKCGKVTLQASFRVVIIQNNY